MFNLKMRIILLCVIIIVAIIWMLTPDKNAEAKKAYLISINLKISGIVKQVMPLVNEDHGYGAIFLQNCHNNKGMEYDNYYQNKYLFCKVKGREAIIITPGIMDIKAGDSVTYDTKTLNYKTYRNGKEVQDNGIAINDDDTFYKLISGYLDFSYYHHN